MPFSSSSVQSTRQPLRRPAGRHGLGLALALGVATAGSPSWAGDVEPRNVVQLSASAQQEAAQDWVTVTVVNRQQAPDAHSVQSQLKSALDQALQLARPSARTGQVEVSTGLFNVQPRYDRERRIVGWQGQAELVLQGRDVAEITGLAGRLPAMVVSGIGFSLSREGQERLESQLRQQAIERFRAAATDVAQRFGFRSYTLREVSVGQGGYAPRPQARMLMASEADGAYASASVPVEPGKSTVQITVSGSIQLQ